MPWLARFRLKAIVLTRQTLKFTIGIAVVEHTIDFRPRVVTTPESVTAASKQRTVRLQRLWHTSPPTSTVVTRASLKANQAANQHKPTIRPSCTKFWGEKEGQAPQTHSNNSKEIGSLGDGNLINSHLGALVIVDIEAHTGLLVQPKKHKCTSSTFSVLSRSL